jgi:hypothetical protein
MGETHHFTRHSRKPVGLLKWLETAKKWGAGDRIRTYDLRITSAFFAVSLSKAQWF